MADLLTRLGLLRDSLYVVKEWPGGKAAFKRDLATVEDAISRERGARDMALKLYAMTEDGPRGSEPQSRVGAAHKEKA